MTTTVTQTVTQTAPAPGSAPWAETFCGERTGTGDDTATCTAVLTGQDRAAARHAAHHHLRTAHGHGNDLALALADAKLRAARAAVTPTAADFPAYDFAPTADALADQGRRTATALVGALVNGSVSPADYDTRSAECTASPQRHFALAFAAQTRALHALLAP